MGDTCWSCGHFLIGGMCFKSGDGSYKTVSHDFHCEDWVNENAEGTITDAIFKAQEESIKGKENGHV